MSILIFRLFILLLLFLIFLIIENIRRLRMPTENAFNCLLYKNVHFISSWLFLLELYRHFANCFTGHQSKKYIWRVSLTVSFTLLMKNKGFWNFLFLLKFTIKMKHTHPQLLGQQYWYYPLGSCCPCMLSDQIVLIRSLYSYKKGSPYLSNYSLIWWKSKF